jgi:hypothetical protein
MAREYFLQGDQFPTLTVLVSAPDTLAGQTWRVTVPLAGLILDGRESQEAFISAVLAARFGDTSTHDVSVTLLANSRAAAWESGFDPRQTLLGSITFEVAFGNGFAGLDDVPLVFTVLPGASDAPALDEVTLPTITTNTTDITLKDRDGGAVGKFAAAVPGFATNTISGNEIVVGLAEGSAPTFITVNHSGDADFAFCEYPRTAAPDGVVVRVVASRDNGDDTTGAQFVLEIENVSFGGGFDYGGTPPDIAIDWTRTGVLT